MPMNLPTFVGINAGHRDGFITCHNNVMVLEDSHSPGNIGCCSCYLRNRLTLDKNNAD